MVSGSNLLCYIVLVVCTYVPCNCIKFEGIISQYHGHVLEPHLHTLWLSDVRHTAKSVLYLCLLVITNVT
jgi:hypothetical protein